MGRRARGRARWLPPRGSRLRRPGARDARPGRRVDLVLVEGVLTEVHDVRAAELGVEEVDLEERREVLAVPAVGLQELLAVGALLVPVGEQRRGDVEALTVPGLRDHVGLLPDLLLHG